MTTQSYFDVQIDNLITHHGTYSLQLGKEMWDEDGPILNGNNNKMAMFLQHLEKTEKDYIQEKFINNGHRKFKLITYHCQLIEYMDIISFIVKAKTVLCHLR